MKPKKKIDLAPVIHARWIIDTGRHVFCDECSYKIPVFIHNIHEYEQMVDKLPKFCPDCGAKMDAKEERA